MKYGLEILLISMSVEVDRVAAISGAALGRRIRAFFLALLAEFYPAKRADDADERSAIRARVAFGRALLVSAGATNHCIAFTEDLAHISIRSRSGWVRAEQGGALNLLQGPHFTTRLAA